MAAAQAHGALREARERAIRLGDREQQCDADQRDQEIDRKALEHLGRRHAGKAHADDQRERER
jgi:hypothetical protein